ncbi:MAG: alpha/beta fold hydrolase [Candidatus Rokubacteria bacterium]|nr:alpha/beta fold hydrolase [Candidatus Rokubacteria bacterium]MBI2554149.1 alpha/beta fold hydrolase [Candidatus Rokubacteria bacterium]
MGWPPSPHLNSCRLTSSDGLRINYVETGSGPKTLCFVHGVGGSGQAWIRQLEDLADTARVVALDLPGHGESGGDGCRRIGDYARVVAGFVEALGVGKGCSAVTRWAEAWPRPWRSKARKSRRGSCWWGRARRCASCRRSWR